MARKKTRETLQDYETQLQAACRDLPPVVVLWGTEAHLRRQGLDAFLHALTQAHPQVETLVLRGPSSQQDAGTSWGEVLHELTSTSLFAPEKAIVLKQADRLLAPPSQGRSQEETAEDAKNQRLQADEERFRAYVESPASSAWLVIACEKLNRQRKLGKTLARAAQCVPCPSLTKPAEILPWLRRTAKALGKRLAPEAADLLFAAHGGNLGSLHAELEKLAIFVDDAPTIEHQDAQAFFTGSEAFEIFGLTNAVEARDLEKALVFSRRILTYGMREAGGKRSDRTGSAHRALAMLARTIEHILAARIHLQRARDAGGLAAALGISPWRAEHLAKAARRYSVAELRRILRHVAEAIHRSHSTGGDVASCLEQSVVACCHQREPYAIPFT